MKIGYTTWGMPKVPVDRALSFLSEQGFDAVELTVLPDYTTAIDRLDMEERRRIFNLFIKYDLTMPAIAAHRSILDEDPIVHGENMSLLKQALTSVLNGATAVDYQFLTLCWAEYLKTGKQSRISYLKERKNWSIMRQKEV